MTSYGVSQRPSIFFEGRVLWVPFSPLVGAHVYRLTPLAAVDIGYRSVVNSSSALIVRRPCFKAVSRSTSLADCLSSNVGTAAALQLGFPRLGAISRK